MSLTAGLGFPLAMTEVFIDANGRSGRDAGKAGPRRGWATPGASRRPKADRGEDTLGWKETVSVHKHKCQRHRSELGAWLKRRPAQPGPYNK